MSERSYVLRYSERVIHIQEVPKDPEEEPVMKCPAVGYRPGGTRLGYDGQILATVGEALSQARYKVALFGELPLCKRCEKAARRVLLQQEREGKGSE